MRAALFSGVFLTPFVLQSQAVFVFLGLGMPVHYNGKYQRSAHMH